jgi:hypothetical protein
MAPLTSVILGSLLVYLTHAEKHGVQVVSISHKLLIVPFLLVCICSLSTELKSLSVNATLHESNRDLQVANREIQWAKYVSI